MNGFSADWLHRREPFDAAARDAAASRLNFPAWLRPLDLREDASVAWRVIDLACGTGANLRWLAPRLGGVQQWLVVDHDAALLAHWPLAFTDPLAHAAAGSATSRLENKGGRLHLQGNNFSAAIERRTLDLARHLEALPFQAATLVTASALLDLVSADWLQRFAAACVAARVAVLLALSVDGRHRWSPVDPDDAVAMALFDAHQHRDKGFGPALGPQAGAAAMQAFRVAGYSVRQARSDWVLNGRADARAAALQHALIDGMADAAAEQGPSTGPNVGEIRGWQARRHAVADRTTLRVGHIDIIATPPVAR